MVYIGRIAHIKLQKWFTKNIHTKLKRIVVVSKGKKTRCDGLCSYWRFLVIYTYSIMIQLSVELSILLRSTRVVFGWDLWLTEISVNLMNYNAYERKTSFETKLKRLRWWYIENFKIKAWSIYWQSLRCRCSHCVRRVALPVGTWDLRARLNE